MAVAATFRSAVAVNTALVVALCGIAAQAGYSWVASSPHRAQPATHTTTAPTTRTSTRMTTARDTVKKVAPFTNARPGDCLTWDIDPQGKVSNFRVVDCALDHRFEVSTRQDLSTYPASEFGPNAQPPDTKRQAQLREELCKTPTIDYLKGTFDPSGRYVIAPILPPKDWWKRGDRTMLCGVQVPDETGTAQPTKGHAATQDQSRVAQVGGCIAVVDKQKTRLVTCDKPHAFEVTKIVDLKEHFPDKIPTIDEQDAYLAPLCQKAALDYLGGDDALYNSTLAPFWLSLPPQAFEAGSHTTNCALMKTIDNKLAVLQGSAKGPFTINGAPPPPQPKRLPRRNP